MQETRYTINKSATKAKGFRLSEYSGRHPLEQRNGNISNG